MNFKPKNAMDAFLYGLVFGLVVVAALGWAGNAEAETGFYYNPDRDGEGIIVTVDDKSRIAWAMFTYWDKNISIPPAVSPAPPSLNLITECHRNSQAWLVGNGVYVDDIAVGAAMISEPIEYPFVSDGSLDEKIQVGTFLLQGYEGGFDLAIDCNELLPESLYMCNNVFTFTQAIIGQ